MPPWPSVFALLVLVLPALPKNRRAIDRGTNAKSLAAHCRLITATSGDDDSFSASSGETAGIVVSGAPVLSVAKEPVYFSPAEEEYVAGGAGL